MMLREELSKKNEHEITQAMRFWGLTGKKSPDEILTAVRDKLFFAGNLLKLKPSEHALLYTLFANDGVVLKGELENFFDTGFKINEIIKSLAGKLFIYLRKDRGLLTDRHDKIYLFPVIMKALEGFEALDEEALRENMLKLMHPMSLFGKNTPDTLKKLILSGGVEKLQNVDNDEYHALYEKGLIDIILADKGLSFVPLWIVTEKAEKYIVQGKDNVNYRSNLYLNNIINITDCLLHSPLRKKYFRKNLGSCVSKLKDNRYSPDRYLQELRYLKIIAEKDDTISIDISFALSSFDQKIKILKKRLTDNDKKVLKCVGAEGKCSKLFVTSSLMINNKLKKIFGEDTEEQTDLPAVLDDLIFRGFLQEGFNGSSVRLNPLENRLPEKNSAVVNTDFEILLFAERLPQHSLYILAGFSHVIQNSEIIRLKTDRFSVSRGIAYFGDIDQFLEILIKSSKGQISNNVIGAVKEWSLSFLEIDIKSRLIIRIDSPDTKFRLFHNRYIQSIVEEETEQFLVLKPEADIDILRQELRKENIYIKLPC
jgi:hypothetical protein